MSIVNRNKGIGNSINSLLKEFESSYLTKLISGDKIIIYNDYIEVSSKELPFFGKAYSGRFNIFDDMSYIVNDLFNIGSEWGEINRFLLIVPDLGTKFWNVTVSNGTCILSGEVSNNTTSPEEDIDFSLSRLVGARVCGVPSEITRSIVSSFKTILDSYSPNYDTVVCDVINSGGTVFIDWNDSREVFSAMCTRGQVSVLRDGEFFDQSEEGNYAIINFSDYITSVLDKVSKIQINFGGDDWSRGKCFRDACVERRKDGIFMKV